VLVFFQRLKTPLFVVAVLLGVAAIATYGQDSTDPARFHVGDQLIASVDCLPGLGCFNERLVIRKVHPDGWLTVTAQGTEGPETWTVNAARIYAYKPELAETRVAAR
jgi:hypothetical protein